MKQAIYVFLFSKKLFSQNALDFGKPSCNKKCLLRSQEKKTKKKENKILS